MRPTPIPDDEIMPDHRRIVVAPPEGHDVTGDIRAVEMLVTLNEETPIYRARWVFDPEDIERIANGEPVWMSLWAHVVPFDLALVEQQ